jgi:cytochrome P450
MLRPSFSRDRISDLPALENHVKHLFDRLPKDGVAVVDLQPLFLGLTLDSSTEFLFGESVESLLRQSATEGQRFAEAFEYAQAEMVKRYRLGPLLPFYFNPRFKKSCKIARGFVEKLVQNALDRQRQTSDHVVSKQRYVFIDALAAETQDPEQLRTAALNILLAGRDTTASLLGNAFYSISQRPDVWTKIRKEVSQLNGEYPSYETLRNLKYIRYTLNESKSHNSYGSQTPS